MQKITLFALLMVSCNLASILSAGIIYQTGFESPVFSDGSLAGQDGWSISGPASSTVVEGTVFKNGLQAIEIQPSTGALDGALHTTSYNAANQMLIFSIDANLSATGTPSFWTVMDTQYVSASSPIDFNIDSSGQIHIYTTGTDHPTGVSITRGVWNHYELDVNFSNNTVSAFYNGAPSLQGASFSLPGTTLGLFAFYSQKGTTTDQAFFDNLSVSAVVVPEPTTFLSVFGAGLFLLLMRRKAATNSCEEN